MEACTSPVGIMHTIIFDDVELDCPDDFEELIEDLYECSYWNSQRLLIDDDLAEQLEQCGLAFKTARGSYTSTPKLNIHKDIIISKFQLKLNRGAELND